MIKSYILLTLLLLIISVSEGICKTIHEVHFENSEYELNIYKIYGSEKGKTLMIIGGIQGDESGGYLSADLYADIALRKGNLIVVPRANFLSIIEHKRAINWDMNRRFIPINNKITKEYYEDSVVEILKDLMAQSDYLLNLHEGSGFFRETWENNIENPTRFGQSIIADTETYYSKKKDETFFLGNIAKKISKIVNERIDNPRYHFRFNNHKTFEKDTSHAEQRKSATFYALSNYEIPAFGIETSKEITDLEIKVRFQTMIINAFMEEFKIIPENPKVALDTPKLKYLIVSVNNSQSIIVGNGEDIKLHKGDKIKISHIEANYERGLSIDIVGIGTANDYNKEFEIVTGTKVIIQKDGFKCGEIGISVSPQIVSSSISPTIDSSGKDNNLTTELKIYTKTNKFTNLVIEINAKRRVLSNGEHLNIKRGDKIKLIDVVTEGLQASDVTVNFLGFVGNKSNNTGEDRGYLINTAKDLWTKYSKDKKGLQYPIAINYRGEKLGEIFVNIK